MQKSVWIDDRGLAHQFLYPHDNRPVGWLIVAEFPDGCRVAREFGRSAPPGPSPDSGSDCPSMDSEMHWTCDCCGPEGATLDAETIVVTLPGGQEIALEDFEDVILHMDEEGTWEVRFRATSVPLVEEVEQSVPPDPGFRSPSGEAHPQRPECGLKEDLKAKLDRTQGTSGTGAAPDWTTNSGWTVTVEEIALPPGWSYDASGRPVLTLTDEQKERLRKMVRESVAKGGPFAPAVKPTMQKTGPIEVGDVVTLASGGPRMTVVEIKDGVLYGVNCRWEKNGHLTGDTFPLATLRHAPQEAT